MPCSMIEREKEKVVDLKISTESPDIYTCTTIYKTVLR